jgi:NAD+ kinase
MIKIHVDAAKTKKAQTYFEKISRFFNPVPIEQADVIVVLGGDGYMLEALHRTQGMNIPLYGIHCGTVGFLMNAIELDAVAGLAARIEQATTTKLHPLKVEIEHMDGIKKNVHAINELTLLRQSHQVCKLAISVNDKMRLDHLAGDGLIVSTAAGSTAYNFSARGPIIPLGVPLLALTPLNPFKPRHWNGAIIPNTAIIDIDVLDAEIRPVTATADYMTFQNIKRALIFEDTSVELNLLFDSDHNLEERILNEQFANGHI